MATSESALPRPWTFLSSFAAAALRRWVAASTDASNSEARADADDAAADAEALAELTAAEAEEAIADGGVPEKDEAFGVLGGLGWGEVPAL
ncbi:hypothetical protein [Streptomyces filipinensis]|nr:hypothetical protein [Streptomyces filipinensis]